MPLGRIAAASALTVCIAGASQAQDLGDVETGLALSQKLCSGCHLVTPDQIIGTYSDGVPSFTEIANGPDVTFERIDNALIQPAHPDMPEPPLSARDRAHVVAYILSLSER